MKEKQESEINKIEFVLICTIKDNLNKLFLHSRIFVVQYSRIFDSL